MHPGPTFRNTATYPGEPSATCHGHHAAFPPPPRRLQRLQRRGGIVRCIPIHTANTGWGLRALEEVSSGDPVAEYLGEVITADEVRQRMQAQRVAQPVDTDHYFMALTNTLYLDAREKGNKARFVNHSCSVCFAPDAHAILPPPSAPHRPTLLPLAVVEDEATSPPLLFLSRTAAWRNGSSVGGRGSASSPSTTLRSVTFSATTTSSAQARPPRSSAAAVRVFHHAQ